MFAAVPAYFQLCLAAVLGLVLGSFYNVCVYRYVQEMSVVKPARSFCPKCRHTLAWYDNIPLLSWLLLRGKCRYCGESISVQYPLVEAASCIWAALLAWKFGLGVEWAAYMLFGGLFIFGSVVDIELMILPDRVTIGGTVLAVLASLILPEPGFEMALLGAVAGGGLFWVLQQIYRFSRGEEGLGTGDVKLMFGIGALSGAAGLPFTILVAAISALIASIIYIRADESRGVKTRVPFGPFLCFGCMAQILVGNDVLRWYLSFYY